MCIMKGILRLLRKSVKTRQSYLIKGSNCSGISLKTPFLWAVTAVTKVNVLRFFKDHHGVKWLL